MMGEGDGIRRDSSDSDRKLPASTSRVEQDAAGIDAGSRTGQQLDRAVEERVRAIMSADLADPTSRRRVRELVESPGSPGAADVRGRLLGLRIRALAQAGSDGSRLAGDLERLAAQAHALDPSRVNFRRGGPRVPFGSSARRYLDRLGATRDTIAEIARSLIHSAETLRQDDVALARYEADVREEFERLTDELGMADALGETLAVAVARARAEGVDPARLHFVEHEVAVPLGWRRQDLRTLLALNRQAALSIALLRDTNATLAGQVRSVTTLATHAWDVGLLLRHEWMDRGGVPSAQRPAGRGADGEDERVLADPTALRESFGELLRTLEDDAAWRRVSMPRMQAAVDALRQMSDQLATGKDAR